jgi:hypothetical protein
MQILGTEVSDALAPDGERLLRVIFRGEGGECVTVDMADVETGHQEAVERAKAILVQTATFALAANEYEARSNGNFDQVAVTSATDQDGSLYIFEYRDGDSSRQVPPSTMPSVEAARQEAIRSAVDLLAEPGAVIADGWLVRVRDRNGDLICSIDAEEAKLAQQANR